MFGTKYAPIFQSLEQGLPLPITEDVGGGVTYIGYSEKIGDREDEEKWMIIRITEAGGLTTPEYANGDSKFNKKWSERATLTYNR